MSHMIPSAMAGRVGRRLALAPLLTGVLMVVVPPAPAASPNAQGVYSSGGAAAATVPVSLSDTLPRPATHDTGRKTG